MGNQNKTAARVCSASGGSVVDHGNESIPVISDENAFVSQCKNFHKKKQMLLYVNLTIMCVCR